MRTYVNARRTEGIRFRYQLTMYNASTTLGLCWATYLTSRTDRATLNTCKYMRCGHPASVVFWSVEVMLLKKNSSPPSILYAPTVEWFGQIVYRYGGRATDRALERTRDFYAAEASRPRCLCCFSYSGGVEYWLCYITIAYHSGISAVCVRDVIATINTTKRLACSKRPAGTKNTQRIMIVAAPHKKPAPA